MKCIRNKKTSDIIRVEDKTAHQMVGSTWEYVSRDTWRASQGIVKETTTVSHDMGGPVETKVSKKKKSVEKA